MPFGAERIGKPFFHVQADNHGENQSKFAVVTHPDDKAEAGENEQHEPVEPEAINIQPEGDSTNDDQRYEPKQEGITNIGIFDLNRTEQAAWDQCVLIRDSEHGPIGMDGPWVDQAGSEARPKNWGNF